MERSGRQTWSPCEGPARSLTPQHEVEPRTVVEEARVELQQALDRSLDLARHHRVPDVDAGLHRGEVDRGGAPRLALEVRGGVLEPLRDLCE